MADQSNNLIRKIDTNGNVTTLAGGGGVTSSGTIIGYVNGQGKNAEFNNPIGISVDSSCKVYVADTGNDVIRVIQ